MLGPVFAFLLPSAIILCVLPAPIEFIDLLLGFRLYLRHTRENKVIIMLKIDFLDQIADCAE